MEKYEDVIENSIQTKLTSNYSKLTGIKRVNTNPPITDQIASLIDDSDYFTLASEKDWKVTRMGILPVFYSEFSCMADEFFIGIFEETINDDTLFDSDEFNTKIKSGLFSSILKVFLNKNVQNRLFDLDVSKKIFISHTKIGNDLVLSFGKSETVVRTLRITNVKNMNICLGVKNGFFKFKKKYEFPSYSWSPNSNIEIDATEVDVLFASIPFVASERISYLLALQSGNNNWSIGVGDKIFTGATFFNEIPLKAIDFGIEDKNKVFIARDEKVTYLEEIPSYLNENEILFDYFPNYGLVRIGSRNVYKTFLVDESLLSFSCVIYIKKSSVVKFLVITNKYDWSEATTNIQNENSINLFSSNQLSGLKVNLNNVNTFSFPSKFIGDLSVRNKHQYFIEFENSNNETFIGFEDNSQSSFQTSMSFNNNSLARVNLLSGLIEVQGSVIGVLSFDNIIKTLYISVMRLSNGSTVFSFGLKNNDFYKNIIIINMVHPKLFITSQSANLGIFKINPSTIKPIIQIIPQTIITQQTDISTLPNIYDVDSEVGSFRIAENDEDEWQILTFDLEENIIAANASILGYKVFIGLVPIDSISNGIALISDNIFSSFLNKSGVLFFPDEMKSMVLINNVKYKDLDITISNDFYCKFSRFNDNICMSIGKNNYSLRNVKLPFGDFKLIFAVSKASFSFFKRKASSILKSSWDENVEIEIDASEYDIQIVSPQITNNVSYFFETMINTNGTFPDLALIDNSILNLPINIGSIGNNWIIFNKNMRTCFIKKNSDDMISGTTNPLVIENSLFFRYGQMHEITESPFVFLGSSPHQYVSNYITSNNILPNSFKFMINVKRTFTRLKVKAHDDWNNTVKNTLVSLTPFIQKSITFDSFNQKIAFKTFNESEKTLIIGPFSANETKVLCFEYEVFNQFTYVGIRPVINNSEMSDSFTNTNLHMNLFSGDISINSITSSRPISQTQHKTLIVKVYPSLTGVFVSFGTNFINANQDIEILDTSLHNYSIYFSAREITQNPFIILKRFSEGGISNTLTQPISILPPSFIPINYDPMQIKKIVGDDTQIRVTSSGLDWSVASWEYVIHTNDSIKTYENYGEIEVTPYLNREPEWFIGYCYDNLQPSSINTLNDDVFDSIVKSGLMFNGIKRSLITNNNIISDAYKDVDEGSFIFSRFFYEIEKLEITDPALLKQEVLLNIAGAIIKVGLSYALSNAAASTIDFIFDSNEGGNEISLPEWKTFDKRKSYLSFYPYIGKNRFNASCLAPFSRAAFTSSGTNLLSKDHKINFIIAVKNGSISYKKHDASLSIPNIFNQDSNVEIFNPTNPIVLRGDILDKISGFFVTTDSPDIYKYTNRSGADFSMLNFGYVWADFVERNETLESLRSWIGAKTYFEVSDVFNGKDSDKSLVNWEDGNRSDYMPNTTFNRYLFDWKKFDLFNFSLGYHASFLRMCSYRTLGIYTEYGNNYFFQIGGNINEFGTYLIKQIPPRKFIFIFFWILFPDIPWPDTYKLIPFIWLNQSNSTKKLQIKNMDSLNNDLFKSSYLHTYDGNLETTHPNLNKYYFQVNCYSGYPRYSKYYETDGTNTVLFKKSHVGSEVSFISASSRGCAFNFELYDDTQDVFFGFIQDDIVNHSNFEYRTSFITPESMLAYINLRTGLVSCGGYNYISSKVVNTIHVSIDKKLLNTRLYIKNFGFFSDGEKGIDIPINHTPNNTFRFIITCGNVVNDKILILNMCEFNSLYKDTLSDVDSKISHFS